MAIMGTYLGEWVLVGDLTGKKLDRLSVMLLMLGLVISSSGLFSLMNLLALDGLRESCTSTGVILKKSFWVVGEEVE